MKRLSRQLNGTTGHIVEGLVSSSTEKIFQKAGLDLHNSGKNLKRSLPSEHIAMEVDVLLSNAEMAVPIEVKATNAASKSFSLFLEREDVRCGYKLVDGNVGKVGKKITIPHYMVMFM